MQDWTRNNDKFEPENKGLVGLAFPCNACKYRYRADGVEPCRSCGHNVNAAAYKAHPGAPSLPCREGE